MTKKSSRGLPPNPHPLSSHAQYPPRPREEERLLMAIDPETREALRLGETPRERGPAFFTSLEALEAFCEAADLQHLEPYEVPASILAHMTGKPFWLDGKPGTRREAAGRPPQRS